MTTDPDQALRAQLYNQAVERGSKDPVKDAREAYAFIARGTGHRRKKAQALVAGPTPLEECIAERVAADAAAGYETAVGEMVEATERVLQDAGALPAGGVSALYDTGPDALGEA